MSDPVRDLNNFLQEAVNGINLVSLLRFSSEQEGPNHQAVHTGTYTFNGVVVGRGKGTAINVAKHGAATQALQFFRTNGIPE